MGGRDRVIPDRPESDRDEAWGDGGDTNDDRLTRDVPPHWSER
jgi:hypothetical protein